MKQVPNQHIHCSISSCHYWEQGNMCHANEILVTSDDFGDHNPDSIDAHQAATIGETPVDSCMATCCKTFVPTNSGKESLDGVKKP